MADNAPITEEFDSQWNQIEREISDEIDRAQKYCEENRTADREKRWDRYYGKPYGNERKGRSKYISRDVMEAIEWILPGMIRLFSSGDPKIEIEIDGQPAEVGKALMQKIQDDLSYDDESSMFIADYMWFKDTLISGEAFQKITWDREYHQKEVEWPQLGTDQMMQLDSDPEAKIISAEESQVVDQMGRPTAVWKNVKSRIKALRKDRLDIEPVPHWEFLWSDKARSINDEHGKGHYTDVSIDYLRRVNDQYKSDEGEPFFKGLGNLEEYITAAREKKSDPASAKETITLCEWYTRLDTDGDGLLEDIICWVAIDYPGRGEEISYRGTTETGRDDDGFTMAGGKLLRWEKNDDDFIPFSVLRAIIDPYKFEGTPFADLLIDLQNLKTQLVRRVLDNFDFTVSGRWFVKPGAKVNVRQLLENIPGDVISGDPEGVVDMAPKPFDASTLGLIEYVDRIKQNRTGQHDISTGSDADVGTRTVGGLSMLQNAAQQRIDLIARVFAETGLKDRYRKCAMLYQKNLREPFELDVRGKRVQVTPEMIKGTIKCRVNMGVSAQVGVEEAQRIERMFGFLAQVSQQYPGLIGPNQVHNLATRYVSSMGFRQTGDFVAEMQQFIQGIQQASQAGQQQRQIAAQAEQAKAQAAVSGAQTAQAEVQLKAQELQLKGQELQINAGAKGGDSQQKMAESTSNYVLEKMKIDQKDREMLMDFQIEAMKIKQASMRPTNARK